MRRDMAKVIVERPRYGSRMPSRKKGYRKFIESTSVEDLPVKESMLGRWRGLGRFLNEHLGPMRRFLRSRVGRPWNKVHQELCEFVSFDNAVQKHVLTHVFDYVRQHVVIDGERIVQKPKWGRWWEVAPGQMYVCPRTGILKVVPPHKQRSPRRLIQNGPHRQYQFRDGVWWDLALRKLPDELGDLWDVWLEREIAALSEADLIAAYGGKVFATSKRPLSRTEARRVLKCFKKD